MKEAATCRTGEPGRSRPFSTVWYGDCRNSQPAIGDFPTDILFTGQRLDDGIDLYFYGARYYDAGIGRFISPDTIVPDPMNPQAFNRYSYCLNNPLKYVDPTGHWEAWCDWSWYENDSDYDSWSSWNENMSWVVDIYEYNGWIDSETDQGVSEVLSGVYSTPYGYGREKNGAVTVYASGDLMADPVPINFVQEQTIAAKALRYAGQRGISLAPIGIYIRDEGRSKQWIEQISKEEYFHWFDETNTDNFYSRYIAESIEGFLYYGNKDLSYRYNVYEQRAKTWAGIMSPQDIQLAPYNDPWYFNYWPWNEVLNGKS